jgi:hypothetical protein
VGDGKTINNSKNPRPVSGNKLTAMKKLMILIISLATVLAACSKSDDKTPPKDYSTAIKGKVWVGELTYSGKTKEYYSVQFKTDNSLIWSEYSGDYAGKWVVDGQRLKLTFTASGKQFNAGITDDNKLIDITNYPTNGWEVNTGEINNNADMVLDNTIWNESHPDRPDFYVMTLSFKQGLKMNYDYLMFQEHQLSYSRIGASIRFKTTKPNSITWFGVITADGKAINGVIPVDNRAWKAVKQ